MPNTHTVIVTPPVGTTLGSCFPNPVNPVGANALIQFQFPPGTTDWSFVNNGFSIKSPPKPQPPDGMFTITASTDNQIVVKDKNGGGVKYSYNISIKPSNGTAVVIDPDIQNEA
ncbi:MAG: hypothetical protein Q7S40_34380 [Opitutaceae bacterium]|nr:hypothetical protein [Opitutaceae bacterium]